MAINEEMETEVIAQNLGQTRKPKRASVRDSDDDFRPPSEQRIIDARKHGVAGQFNFESEQREQQPITRTVSQPTSQPNVSTQDPNLVAGSVRPVETGTRPGLRTSMDSFRAIAHDDDGSELFRRFVPAGTTPVFNKINDMQPTISTPVSTVGSTQPPSVGTTSTGTTEPTTTTGDPLIDTGPGSGSQTLGRQYDALRNQLASNLIDPQLPEGARQTATLLDEQAGEILDPTDDRFQVAQQTQVAATGYSASKAAMAAATTPAEMQAAMTGYAEVTAAAKGTVSRLAGGATASAVQAQAAIQDLDKVDPKTIAEAITRDLPNEATVKGQLDQLLDGLEGGQIPLWAQPAVAQAESMMASRGLSTSSVGRNALFNSIISAALPIAQQDSQSKLAVFQQNLSNEQQTTLANSQFFQNLTMKNLDNRQQAAIVNATNATNANIATAQNMTQASIANAQAFLQMDIANLNNEQQAAMATAQFRQQAMLTNAAAENTARQFNAANQQQADQFNANLEASINQFNATQNNAAKQFNANALNAASQFNANMNYQRDQFNAQNATALAQSNVQWRRQMNLTNTAAINAVNQANAMNQFNLSNQALTFLWQEQRDAAKWANDNAQNEEERKTRMAIAALSNESMKDAKTLGNIKALAGAAISIFDNWND